MRALESQFDCSSQNPIPDVRAIRLTLLFLFLAVPGFTAGPGSRSLRLADYLDLKEVSDPQISPDSRNVVYVHQQIDKLNDKWVSSLVIMSPDGSKSRPFLSRAAGRGLEDFSSPRWSPDSKRVAFLAKRAGGKAQLFVAPLTGTVVTQLTHDDQGPSGIAWSPDGKSIAFARLVPNTAEKEKAWQIALPVRAAGAKWTPDPRIVERMVFRLDGISDYVDEGYRHVFVVPAEGGKTEQLTSGNTDQAGGGEFEAELSWTPDGTEILYSSMNPEAYQFPWKDSDIYAVSLSNREVRQLTRRAGPDEFPVVSPDGRWVAYTGHDASEEDFVVHKIYVMGIDGSNPHILAPELDLSPHAGPYRAPEQRLFWAPDSSGIYFNPIDRGTRDLYFISLRGEVRQVTKGNHILRVTSISNDGRFVGTLTSSHQPMEVATTDTKQPEIKRITSVNDRVLRNIKLADVEEIWYASDDGLRIQGWIYKPPDFDPSRKYPFILNIHGGPHGMDGVGFNFALQEHAAHGYVVLDTNPRGSTGYGSAFANAISNAYPGKDFNDLMKGVDEVVRRGYVSTSDLFVYGCSGGGVLTSWIVGHTDRFAAASANCPVTDWFSFVGNTDGMNFYLGGAGRFKKMPWEDPSEHLARSPLMYVGNVKTPTLLMTGELDMVTPISQTEEFYRALKIRGIPTAMIRFHGEGHGIHRKPSNVMRYQLYLRRWFERYRSHGANDASSAAVTPVLETQGGAKK